MIHLFSGLKYSIKTLGLEVGQMGIAQNFSLWDAAHTRETLCHPLYSHWTNPLIQGISDEGKDQHKLALFADDIILFLENPTTSVPALLHSLNEYSAVSGYKVNTSKSKAMMITGIWPSQLDELVSFRRSKQGFRYLGVVLTPKTTQLLSANYNKLMKEINNDLSR